MLPSSAFFSFLLLLTTINCQTSPNHVWYLQGESDDDEAFRVQRRGHPAYRHHIRTAEGLTGSGVGGSATGGAGEATLKVKSVEEDEPSCDELRTIWRLTKRAAMKSLLSNEVPDYTVGSFGHIIHSPDTSSARQYVHGKKVYRAGEVGRKKMANTLSARTAGSYERVEEELRRGLFAEKPYYVNGKINGKGLGKVNGDVVYGVYSNRGGVTEPKVRPTVSGVKSGREKQRMDKMAKTAAKTMAGSTAYGKNNAMDHNSGCETLASRRCDWSVDCTCYTSGGGGGKLMYKCIQGKCTNSYSSINNGRELPVVNKWHHYTSPTSGVSYYRSDYPVVGNDWNAATDTGRTSSGGYGRYDYPTYRDYRRQP